jgi:hypothetical protein
MCSQRVKLASLRAGQSSVGAETSFSVRSAARTAPFLPPGDNYQELHGMPPELSKMGREIAGKRSQGLPSLFQTFAPSDRGTG